MALTYQPEFDEKMRLFVSHGITRAPSKMTHESEGSRYYQPVVLDSNYRMTDMPTALVFPQLRRLDQYVERGHVLAKRHNQALAELSVRAPVRRTEARSSFHLYVIRVGAGRRGGMFEAPLARGIGVNVRYIPVHPPAVLPKYGF